MEVDEQMESNSTVNHVAAALTLQHRKLSILWKSMLVGIGASVVVSAYRYALTRIETLTHEGYEALRHGPAGWIILAFVALVIAGAGVGWLVKRNPMIGGSGIPQVKGVILGHFSYPWLETLVAKFAGGCVSLLAGLSLGREGPSIQLGATVAQGIASKVSPTRTERKILIASGASAGLAAAFNAPLAGVIFVLEEIFRYFSPVILLSTMVSAVVADFFSKMVFGMQPVFSFTVLRPVPLSGYGMLLLLGALTGAAGAGYNAVLLFTQRLYRRGNRLPVWGRPVIPFVLAGLLGLVFPVVTGSGHRMLALFRLDTPWTLLLLVLAVKFIFSMLSFGSGAPGGIFFPLLILGANLGALFAMVCVDWMGWPADLYDNLIILAMAGMFAGIVRAPVTGVVLLLEMTGSFHQLLPLSVVSLVAFVSADVLRSAPIYESLLDGLVGGKDLPRGQALGGKRITAEFVVHHGSLAEKTAVRDLHLPARCLLVAVSRGGHDILPKGDTRLLAGDMLVVLTDTACEGAVRQALEALTTAP